MSRSHNRFSLVPRIPPLRTTLRADAAVCLAAGAVLAIGAGVYAVSRPPRIRPTAVAPILAVELMWIAASAALLVTHGATLTAAGIAVVLTGAVAVLGFLVAEWLGLRAESRATRERTEPARGAPAVPGRGTVMR